ncbi:hypothetical protein [Blastopirellula marina]|uniref:Uncharacterized protein n=1 Tax=Blastopirellula marina TaxID=124 RepID=A0A2S8GJ83_9BACT|nr:hypothetical protein [Blastopirellula marina]PQO44517.1 hypothetical protein C5Y93_19105 [Blastopirellula marina]
MLANDENSASTNPFASPQTTVTARRWKTGEFLVSNGRIVGGQEIWLPFLCIKCGENVGVDDASAVRESETKPWVHPLWIALAIANFIAFIIVAIFITKKCSVTYSICRDCQAKRRKLWWFLGTTSGTLAGIGVCMVLLQTELLFPLLLFFTAGFMAVLWFATWFHGPLKVYWYSNETFQLSGAGEAFLRRAEMVEAEEPAYTAVLAEDGRKL